MRGDRSGPRKNASEAMGRQIKRPPRSKNKKSDRVDAFAIGGCFMTAMPATRVISLAAVDKSDAPDDLNQIDSEILIEVVLLGLMPDREAVVAIVSMTAEDESRIIQWQTTMPHQQFSELLTMRSIINLPKNLDGVQTDQSYAKPLGQFSANDRTLRNVLAVSGKAIAKFWKLKFFTDKETTLITIKYLKKVADLLPELWKSEALKLASELERRTFKSLKLKRQTLLFCELTAELITTI